jgi:hypothetical protein
MPPQQADRLLDLFDDRFDLGTHQIIPFVKKIASGTARPQRARP